MTLTLPTYPTTSLFNIGQDSETRMASKDQKMKSVATEKASYSLSATDSYEIEIEIETEKKSSDITTGDKKCAGKVSAKSSTTSSPKSSGIRSALAISGEAANVGKLDSNYTHSSQNSTHNFGSNGELRNFETIKSRRESSASSPRLNLNAPGEYNAAYLKEALFKLRSAVGEKQGNVTPRDVSNDRARKPSYTDVIDTQLPPLKPLALSTVSAADSSETEIDGQNDDVEQLNLLPLRYITTSPSMSPNSMPSNPYHHLHHDDTAEAAGTIGDLSTNSNTNSLATVPLSSRDEQVPICPALVLQLPPTPAELSRIMSLMGSNLLSVGSIVGHQAADVAVVMGAAVAVQAERVLSSTSEIVPRYSNQDMKRVITRKNVLLGELSQSCLQLGIMQDKEKEMAALIQELNTKEAELQERQVSEHFRANVLESQLCGLRDDVKNEVYVTQAVRCQLEEVRLELKTEKYVAESLRATLDEMKLAAAAQSLRLAQNSESEQRTKRLLEVSREERARDVAAVQSELHQMSLDSIALREDMRLASEQAVAQVTGMYVYIRWCLCMCVFCVRTLCRLPLMKHSGHRVAVVK